MKPFFNLVIGLVVSAACAGVIAAEPVKIAFIDPLSGPFANVGEMEVRAYQYSIEQVNARGGVLGGTKLELVPFDNKANPQDALLALKQATDQAFATSRKATAPQSRSLCLTRSASTTRANRAARCCFSTMPRSIPRSPTSAATSGISASMPTQT